MLRRACSKLLALRSVARPNQGVPSSPWSAILRPSATNDARRNSETATERLKNMNFVAATKRVEPEAELVGGDLVDMEFLKGPFGTKESPAVLRSYYDERIVGCSGSKEAEHATKWFWLKNGEPRVCPSCSQYFQLKCVGAGGFPLLEELEYQRM